VHTIDSHDRVHELPDVLLPSSGAPDPIVLADEDTLVITYITATDETFASHPLTGRGLRPCGAFEVQSSSWLRDLEVRNRGHPRHDPQLFHQLRHWVWTFHDSVLECAALTYTVVEAQGLADDLLPQMRAQLRSS
jgi:hypothetical protein